MPATLVKTATSLKVYQEIERIFARKELPPANPQQAAEITWFVHGARSATASGNVCACVKLAGKHLLTGNRNGRKLS